MASFLAVRQFHSPFAAACWLIDRFLDEKLRLPGYQRFLRGPELEQRWQGRLLVCDNASEGAFLLLVSSIMEPAQDFFILVIVESDRSSIQWLLFRVGLGRPFQHWT